MILLLLIYSKYSLLKLFYCLLPIYQTPFLEDNGSSTVLKKTRRQEGAKMTETKDIVIAYQEAQNSHNIDLALSFFAPDIRFEMVGIWVMQGMKELRAYAEWNAVIANKLTFGKLKIKNTRLECQAQETNEWLKLVGIDVVNYDAIKFEFENGKIRHIRAKVAPKSEMAMDKATNRVIRWALDKYPDEVVAVIPRGVFKYTEEAATKWMNLVTEWLQHTAKN